MVLAEDDDKLDQILPLPFEQTLNVYILLAQWPQLVSPWLKVD